MFTIQYNGKFGWTWLDAKHSKKAAQKYADEVTEQIGYETRVLDRKGNVVG